MLHRIQISTNTCEVTMQVKRAIRKATLHKLPIYKEYMRLCQVSTLFCMICCLFSKCSKSSSIRLRSLYITFSLCCEYSTFSCARTPCNAMKRDLPFIGAENIYEQSSALTFPSDILSMTGGDFDFFYRNRDSLSFCPLLFCIIQGFTDLKHCKPVVYGYISRCITPTLSRRMCADWTATVP